MAEKEYIDRNELIKNLKQFAPEHYTPLIDSLIKKQPAVADVFKVTKCKDCTYRVSECEPEHSRTQHYCKKNDIFVTCDYFCSYGMRKWGVLMDISSSVLLIICIMASTFNFVFAIYNCSDIVSLKDENRKLKDELHFLKYKIEKPPNKGSNVRPAPPKKVEIIIRKREK